MSRPAENHDDVVDMAALGIELLATTADSHAGGRAAQTVLHAPGLRATVIALRAGHELAEHAAPPAATLYVYTGRVRLRAGSVEKTIGAGQLAPIPPERHSLVADTDAVVLLTVRYD